MLKIVLGISFASLLFAGEASAQWLREKIFQLNKSVSEDSQFRVESRILLKPETRWVWVSVIKDNKKQDSFLETAGGGDFSSNLWLRFGPGNYKVRILHSTAQNKYNSSYYVDSEYDIENKDPRENIDFLAPTAEIQSDSSDLIDLADSIVAGLGTEMEKINAIHDWVTSSIAYDVKAYNTKSYVNSSNDALMTYNDRMAVCQGYAHLTAALHRAAGIPAKVVMGEAIRQGETWRGKMNHAWNEVLVDGKWIIMDTTWDAGYVDFSTQEFKFRPQKKYFNPSREVFALDHREM